MAVNKILAGLNDKQRQAVKTTNGPLLINAVAGSGKTRTLTRHIAYLVEYKHVNPYNILAITFTNKAAGEMRQRVNQLLSNVSNVNDIWISTFHALGMRILRKFHKYIGYPSSFTIAGPSSQRTTVKHILANKLNVDTKTYPPREILGDISAAKNDLKTPDNVKASYNHHNPFQKIVAKAYPIYQQVLKDNHAMDFDDLIMKPVLLFKKFPGVLHYYQNRFLYIHVDEYQDTNEAQYQMVSLLAKAHQNICVVGDADQSIYGWRGANIQNILNFKKDYPSANVILMNENYRSTKNILKVANCVIQNNDHRPKDKKLWTTNDTGPKVGYYRAESGGEEANFVASKIRENHLRGYKYRDMAVLYRTNAQSRAIEKALTIQAIPYQIVGGLKFYDRREIKDTMNYLTLLVNSDDNTAFEATINTPKRGIGQKSISKISAFAIAQNLSMYNACKHIDKCTTLGTRVKNKVKKFVGSIEDLKNKIHKESVTQATKDMWNETGYLPAMEKKAEHSIQAQGRISNLKEFLSVTTEYDKKHHKNYVLSTRLNSFLSDTMMQSAQDETDDSKSQVTLMTIHASKGLEYPIVFLIGMEENMFPLAHEGVIENLPEERRLCYVAITRAEKKLYLSNAVSRMIYGQGSANPPSRFLHEINPHYLQPVVPKSRQQIASDFFNQNQPPADKPF